MQEKRRRNKHRKLSGPERHSFALNNRRQLKSLNALAKLNSELKRQSELKRYSALERASNVRRKSSDRSHLANSSVPHSSEKLQRTSAQARSDRNKKNSGNANSRRHSRV